jgi:hypothetical protein
MSCADIPAATGSVPEAETHDRPNLTSSRKASTDTE